MSRGYSLRVGCGRLLHAVFLIIGSTGVLIELTFWHGRWDHLLSYLLVWVGASFLGRIVRAVLSRE